MTRTKLVAAAIAGAVVLGSAPALAQINCVNKAGEGTNNTEDGAKFQAWEIILQTSDIGGWMQWMSNSQKVGVAPGFKVSNLRQKCTKGSGLGYTCVVQARLCK